MRRSSLPRSIRRRAAAQLEVIPRLQPSSLIVSRGEGSPQVYDRAKYSGGESREASTREPWRERALYSRALSSRLNLRWRMRKLDGEVSGVYWKGMSLRLALSSGGWMLVGAPVFCGGAATASARAASTWSRSQPLSRLILTALLDWQ
jgi:hypothetical protein